jgi:23S rRNA pseudouridine1911/1915/1917 synthase
MRKIDKCIVNEIDIGTRIDSYVASKNERISRTLAQELIKAGKILVNGSVVKPSIKVELGQEITIEYEENDNQNIRPIAQDIPIDIIFEDDDIIVVNKPKNMVVHPAVGNLSGTLVNAVLGRSSLSDVGGQIRPGIVHRLDKNTSGVLVIAKNNYSHNKISEQIQKRTTKKIYLALVKGIIAENDGVINMPIGRHPTDRKKMAVVKDGKEAITKFKVLERFSKGYTFVEVELKTGRTHQIRVHMSHIGHPIVGDDIYSNGKNEFNVTSQLLHSHKLGFVHPTKNTWVEFEATLPKEFEEIINKLRNE